MLWILMEGTYTDYQIIPLMTHIHPGLLMVGFWFGERLLVMAAIIFIFGIVTTHTYCQEKVEAVIGRCGAQMDRRYPLSWKHLTKVI